jgi:hypothetical protein
MVINNNGNYGKYIVQNLQEPNWFTEKMKEHYKTYAERILFIDSHVIPGAFQMNTSWFFRPTPENPALGEHVHNFDEMLGFYGSDPTDPHNLGGEINIHIEGEKYVLIKSSLIFIPGGVKHMPLSVERVDKPIFHFSVAMNPEYTSTALDKDCESIGEQRG